MSVKSLLGITIEAVTTTKYLAKVVCSRVGQNSQKVVLVITLAHSFGAPPRIRTEDLRIKSPLL